MSTFARSATPADGLEKEHADVLENTDGRASNEGRRLETKKHILAKLSPTLASTDTLSGVKRICTVFVGVDAQATEVCGRLREQRASILRIPEEARPREPQGGDSGV